MSKKSSKKEFERMLDELFQEHEKEMISDRIKRGMKTTKVKKSKKYA